MFGLMTKITLPIIAIITLALGLMVLFGYVKFERTFADLTRARLGVILQNVRTTLETGLDLGLELRALSNAKAVIERAVHEEPHILALLIFDSADNQYQLLFASVSKHVTDRLNDVPPDARYSALVPTRLPVAWQPLAQGMMNPPPPPTRRPSEGLPAPMWQHVHDTDLTLGLPLNNNFGQTVGTLVLRYDGVFYIQTLRDALRDIRQAAAILAGLMSLGALWAVAWIVRPYYRQLRRVRQALDAALTQPNCPPFQPHPDAPLEIQYAAVEQRSRLIHRQLATFGKIVQLEAQLHAPSRAHPPSFEGV